MALLLASSLGGCLDGEVTPTPDNGSGSDDVTDGSDDGTIDIGEIPQVKVDQTPAGTTCAHRRKGDGRCL